MLNGRMTLEEYKSLPFVKRISLCHRIALDEGVSPPIVYDFMEGLTVQPLPKALATVA